MCIRDSLSPALHADAPNPHAHEGARARAGSLQGDEAHGRAPLTQGGDDGGGDWASEAALSPPPSAVASVGGGATGDDAWRFGERPGSCARSVGGGGGESEGAFSPRIVGPAGSARSLRHETDADTAAAYGVAMARAIGARGERTPSLAARLQRAAPGSGEAGCTT